MDRERITRMGSQPMNGDDAFAVLGIVFDWAEEKFQTSMPQLSGSPDVCPQELVERLNAAGYFYG